MRLFRKVGIPLIALLILLILMFVTVVLMYEQNGRFLPFAGTSTPSETTDLGSGRIKLITISTISFILEDSFNDQTIPHTSY